MSKVNKTTFKVKNDSTLYSLTDLCPKGEDRPLYRTVPSAILEGINYNKIYLTASNMVTQVNDDTQAFYHNMNTSFAQQEIIDELKKVQSSIDKIKELIR